MDYLNLIWYILALIVIGAMLYYIIKQNGFYTKKDSEEYENNMKETYGKKGYTVIKIIGWCLLILFWLYMLGKCSEDYLKI